MTGVEIAVSSVAGAVVAREQGADRVELCSALELGGVTPSAGVIAEATAAFPGAVHVLVRPRPGDFRYQPAEVAVIERDIADSVRLGAAGVVVGALDADGEVDLPLMNRWVQVARGASASVEVTAHRAVDQTRDPLAAIVSLAGVVDRVLTSGGAPSVAQGLPVLRAAKAEVGDGLQVMAGGGLRIGDIRQLIGVVDAVHLSAKRRVPGLGGVALGSEDDGSHLTTDAEVVRAAVRTCASG